MYSIGRKAWDRHFFNPAILHIYIIFDLWLAGIDIPGAGLHHEHATPPASPYYDLGLLVQSSLKVFLPLMK